MKLLVKKKRKMDSGLITFVDVTGRFKFTVKKNFINKCHNYLKLDVYNLISEYGMDEYLHNPAGPSIVHINNQYMEYWLDGKKVVDTNAITENDKRLLNNFQFHDKLLKEILG